MKRLLMFALACIFALTASACSAGTDSSPEGSQPESTTIEPTPDPVEGLSSATGQVTDIDGLVYTLALGKISTSPAAGSEGGSAVPPEIPSGAPPEMPAETLPDGMPAGPETAQAVDPPRSASETGEEAAQEMVPESASAAAPEPIGGGAPPEPAESATATPQEETGGAAPRPDGGAGPDAAGGAPPEPPSGAPGGGSRFIPDGRTLEVDMQNAVVRSNSGSLERDVPVSDIVVGDVITVFLTDSDTCAYVTLVAPAEQVLGSQGQAEQGSAANEIDAAQEISGETFASSGDDENALRVTGAQVTLTDVTVNKDGGSCSSTESGDFYGMNAALLATDGADVIIRGGHIESNAVCGNGVFSYGSGTSVSVSASEIVTSSDHSGGLQTAGGASMDAQDLSVTTRGSSSAAIRSDRGGGTVTVNGGTYSTEGLNSPAVYSTAEISVTGAELRASGSEALVVEGQNSLSLSDCTVSGAMSRTEGSSSAENVHNIMLYQSMSGDAEEGQSNFVMNGGSLTSQNGDMFFVTNTACRIELSGVQINNRDQLAWLFNIAGNSGSLGWGAAGSNGAHADITLRGQNTIGDTRVDSISSLSMHLAEGTYLRGGIRLEPNEAAAEGAVGVADVVIDEGCTWSLTGNSEVTTLINQGTIEFNGHTITLADGTVLSA